ncbi:MAG: radical SAM protein [Oscillospiraceae bacterium]|nr:radical SAM protein [Oscillospiraceae bacterium]
METLRISWYTITEDLGPQKRFALWVQGCRKQCEGCIAPTLRDINGGTEISVTEMADIVISSGCDITISGGEPFLQSEALHRMIGIVREKRPQTGVICYTGYRYEDICDDPFIQDIDPLIDGEYIGSLDDGRPMRGSSNQRLLFLTNRYSEDDMPTMRKNSIIFTENGFRMTGIPSDGARAFIDIMNGE